MILKLFYSKSNTRIIPMLSQISRYNDIDIYNHLIKNYMSAKMLMTGF